MSELGGAPPIEPGTTLGDGTRIGEYLGKSAGALNFFGEHVDAGRVVVKVLAPALDATLESMRDELDALRRLRHPALQPLVSSVNFKGRHLLTYAFVDGRTIRSVLAKRVAASGPFDFETTYNVLGHASAAIEHLHSVMAHGVLTDENVFVLRDGQIQVGNAGYAQLMLRSYGGDGDVFGRSAFLAPEVRDDPWSATPAADIYSLGVLAVEMLTGVQPTRANLPDLLEAAGVNQPAAVGEVLARCLSAEPSARFESLASLRDALTDARNTVAAVRTQVDAPRGEGDLSEVLAAISLTRTPADDATTERFMWRRDTGDFGPYTAEAVRRMLEADELDEHSVIVDTFEDTSAALVDIPTFTDFVMDYLPKRQKRRLAQEERREEVVTQVKRTSVTTIVAGVLALVVGAVLLAKLQQSLPELAIEDVVLPIQHSFVVEEPVFTEIAANDALVARLFDTSEPIEPARSSSGSRSSRSREEAYQSPSLEDYVLAFDSSSPARKLSYDEINATLNSHVGNLQVCFRNELESNPGFQGITVQLAIVPDGRTADLSIRAEGELTSDGRRCVTRVFRRMRFPEFNDVPMRVSFPFAAR